MAALNATTTLSGEAIASIQASLKSLNNLAIMIETVASVFKAVQRSSGANDLVAVANGVHDMLAYRYEPAEELQLSVDIVELLETGIAPALSVVVDEPKALWFNIQKAIEAGVDGRTLVCQYMLKALEEHGALVRLYEDVDILTALEFRSYANLNPGL